MLRHLGIASLLLIALPLPMKAQQSYTMLTDSRQTTASRLDHPPHSLPLSRSRDFSSFSELPDMEKSKVIWDLIDKREFGKPEHKPICRELLARQGRFTYANAVAFTDQAMDMVVKYHWTEFQPLVQAIYDHPDNVWLLQASIQCLRALAGRTIPKHLFPDVQTLRAAGFYKSKVTDAELTAAKQRLIREPDQDAVLAFTLCVAAEFPGKGGTERGKLAAIDVIRTLEAQRVKNAVGKLKGMEARTKGEVNWVLDRLKSGPPLHEP